MSGRLARYDFLDHEGKVVRTVFGVHLEDDFDLDWSFQKAANERPLEEAADHLLSLEYQRGYPVEDPRVFLPSSDGEPELWREAVYDEAGILVDLVDTTARKAAPGR